MHVGVEEIVPEDLREEYLDTVLRQPLDIRAGRLERRLVADRDAADALHRQHIAAAKIPVHLRHVEQIRAFEVAFQLRGVGGLAHQIDLVAQCLLELGDDGDGPQALRGRPIALGQAGDRIKHLDIGLDLAADVGPQHLDHDLLPVMQRRDMNLGHRGRRQRLAFEARVALGDAAAERLLDRRDCDLGRERRHVVLQLRELVGDLGRQEIAAHRKRLAEFHEQWPELLEREPDAHPERPLAPAAEGEQAIDPAERAEQMRRGDDLVEAVAHERALDRHQSERETDAEHLSRPRRDAAARAARSAARRARHRRGGDRPWP